VDLDPVEYGPFWSEVDPDPDIWERIRILALINDPSSTFLVCAKVENISVAYLFESLILRFSEEIWPKFFKVRIRSRTFS
jgi:hypothetical protein